MAALSKNASSTAKNPMNLFRWLRKSQWEEVKIIVYGETRKIPYDDVQSLLRSKKYC